LDRAGAVAASALAIDDIAIFVRSADAAAACGRSRVRAAGARVEVDDARASLAEAYLAGAGGVAVLGAGAKLTRDRCVSAISATPGAMNG
jgi:hypothetical protein